MAFASPWLFSSARFSLTHGLGCRAVSASGSRRAPGFSATLGDLPVTFSDMNGARCAASIKRHV